MSDISSFAEWEAQQQLEADGDVLSEHQQKLIDMASEYRIWADRDSSNDYRSSASEDEEGGVELPVNEGRPVDGGEGKVKTVNGGLMGRFGRVSRLGDKWKISSLSQGKSQSLSQRLAREAEDEDEVSGHTGEMGEIMEANLCVLAAPTFKPTTTCEFERRKCRDGEELQHGRR